MYGHNTFMKEYNDYIEYIYAKYGYIWKHIFMKEYIMITMEYFMECVDINYEKGNTFNLNAQ